MHPTQVLHRHFCIKNLVLCCVFGSVFTYSAAYAQSGLLDGTNQNNSAAQGAPAPAETPPKPPATTPPTPPAQPVMAVYVLVNGQQTGPFDEAVLAQMAAAGQIENTTIIWQAGMTDWAAASTVAEVTKILMANIPVKPALDGKSYIVGTWISEPSFVPVEGMGQGTLTGTTTFNANGTLSQYLTLEVPMQYDKMRIVTTVQGTYTIQNIDASSFMVTPNATGTSTIQGGTSGPQQETSTTPFLIRMIDQSTLRDGSGVIMHRQ